MNGNARIRIGSRGSRLALLQARWVMDRLKAAWPGLEFEIVTIATTGDRNPRISLERLGGVGVFVKELEEALIGGRIDLAVHSLKDMLTTVPEGLQLAAVPERADPRDALVSRYGSLAALPKGAVVGTGSQRRAVQALAIRPDLVVRGLRGNIDTRLRKLAAGQYDGIVMAAAALIRSGWQDKITEYLPPETFIPAVGQGALGIEIRSDDRRIAEIVAPLNNRPTWDAVTAERAFLRTMGGGCRAPIAALGTVENGTLRLCGMVSSPDGRRILRAEVSGDAFPPEELGLALARKMIDMGAAALLAETGIRDREHISGDRSPMEGPFCRDESNGERIVNGGKVYIVGAGPGDPGLISVKAVGCLRGAGVVVYDRLVDESLLDYVPAGAERIYVGKSARVHAKEQEEINRILIEKARDGKAVVRLKGGDPFVLGRGGEECEALAAAGIPFEVIPGISSALAGPAYAGIPVTHRHISSSFAVVTGHEDPTKETSSIHWEKLATGVDTLVFLMGMGNLSGIARRLIENGRSPRTPAALIHRGTTLEQRVLTGTLEDIAEGAQKAGIEPPAVIVIGEVVGLREKLRWFESRPLFGRRILVTRARPQASALARLLAERGAVPIELPMIAISPLSDTLELDRAVQDLPVFDWVIFTSANGVGAVWDRVRALGLDARQFGKTKIAAIGPATAEALESHGLRPDFMPGEFISQSVLAGLAERGIAGRRILLPRSNIAPKDLVEGLKRLGAEPHDVVAYETKPAAESASRAREMLESRRIDIITFTSSSTVTNLLEAVGRERIVSSRAAIACIGPVTAAAAEKAGLKVTIVAREQTIPGLVAAIEGGCLDA